MATVLPSRLARLRARFEPITARPTTPMFAIGARAASGPVGVGADRVTSSGAGAPSCARVEPGWSSRSVEMFVWAEESFEDTRTPEDLMWGGFQPRVWRTRVTWRGRDAH